MAKIVCNETEFHRYVGPRVRNVIQYKTRARKRTVSRCELCKKSGVELEAAHRHGSSRKEIVDGVLKQFYDRDNRITGDLAQIEAEIVRAQTPIEKYFLMLCRKCHVEYDKRGRSRSSRHGQRA